VSRAVSRKGIAVPDAIADSSSIDVRSGKSYWKDLLILLTLVLLALFAPFVLVFQQFPEMFTEQLAGMFSSATWSFTVVHDPPVYNNQMSFVLFAIADYPVLLVIAVLRLGYVLAIYGHRQGFIHSHVPVFLGALMFSCIMAVCIFVTFNLSLAGLSSVHLLPSLPSEIASLACYPCPALFLVGLIWCSRKESSLKTLTVSVK